MEHKGGLKMEHVNLIFTKKQIQNLMAFLDRVSYQGFNEIAAVQEIMAVLQSDEGTTKSQPKE